MTPLNLAILIAVQIVCALVIFLLLRRPSAPQQDTKLTQIQDQLTNMETRSQAAEGYISREFEAMRKEASVEAQRVRDASETAFRGLRDEVTGNVDRLGKRIQDSLSDFRRDNSEFVKDANKQQTDLREALSSKLTELMRSNEAGLKKLNEDNARELDKMRQTVDEKLHATLQTRLTESFGQVTEQLSKVHTGLGEMSRLSADVSDLSRIFTNVKSRGGFAEVQLGMLLEQMLAPSQFDRNVRVKEGSREVVEFAVRFPGPNGETLLLPIDAKFPREDWERLEAAYESNKPEDVATAGKAFESAIRTEGDRISRKYINEPVTTPYAIMFLPTEGLYAEVMRRAALQAEIQSRFHVTIAGPSTLFAILTSFQMGFRMLTLQEKGDEVWKILAGTKKQFLKFEELMVAMGRQVGTVQSTIEQLHTRASVINKTLKKVDQPSPSAQETSLFEPDVTPLALAAAAEED